MSKKQGFYGLIAITLIICLSLAVYLTSGLNTNPFTSQSTNQTQSISPTPTAHEPENSNETTEPITESQNNTTLLTKEEAMQIATPALEQYAKEHNRTITGIYASFNATAPAWHVNANFARIEFDLTASSEDAKQYWIAGYLAYVKADTGEILSAFPMTALI
jgi:hypothetical protein